MASIQMGGPLIGAVQPHQQAVELGGTNDRLDLRNIVGVGLQYPCYAQLRAVDLDAALRYLAAVGGHELKRRMEIADQANHGTDDGHRQVELGNKHWVGLSIGMYSEGMRLLRTETVHRTLRC